MTVTATFGSTQTKATNSPQQQQQQEHPQQQSQSLHHPLNRRLLVATTLAVLACPVGAWTSRTSSHCSYYSSSSSSPSTSSHAVTSPALSRRPSVFSRTRSAATSVKSRGTRTVGSTRLCAHREEDEGDLDSEHGREHKEKLDVDRVEHEEGDDEDDEEKDGDRYLSRLSSDHVELFRYRLMNHDARSSPLDATPLQSYKVGNNPDDASRVTVPHLFYDDEQEDEYEFKDDMDHLDDFCDPFDLNASHCNEVECEIPTHFKGVFGGQGEDEASDNPLLSTDNVMEFLGIKRAAPLERRLLGDWE